MKVLNVAGKTVSIDTDRLSKGLCEMHEQDEEKKTILAFGMLDHKLCQLFGNKLEQAIKEQFSEQNNELFSERIEKFAKDCNSEVAKGVYKYATMVV